MSAPVDDCVAGGDHAAATPASEGAGVGALAGASPVVPALPGVKHVAPPPVPTTIVSATAASDVAVATTARERGDPDADSGFEPGEHAVAVADLADVLLTRVDVQSPELSQGLTPAEAATRLSRDGRNALTPPLGSSELCKFLAHFADIFMVMLLVAAALSFVSYAFDTAETVNLWLGVVLVAIVTLNVLIAYLQERQSSRVMGTLSTMLSTTARVVRDGVQRDVDAETLVRGDVVVLSSGNRVPADVRLFYVQDLRVEASALTGETEPVRCTVNAVGATPQDACNMVFLSSLVVQGNGWGVVVRTGDRTLIGDVARLAAATRTTPTTLEREVRRFVLFIAALALTMATTLFVVGVAQGGDVVNVFVLTFITVLVANVPQGLPATVTSALSIAAGRMQQNNVFVKRLDSVETLGSASCICTDKTGTITENRMAVQNIWDNGTFDMLHGGVTQGIASHDTSKRADTVNNARGGLGTGNDGVEQQRRRSISSGFSPAVLRGNSLHGRSAMAVIAPLGETSITRRHSRRDTLATSADAHRQRLWWCWHEHPHNALLTVACVCNEAAYDHSTVAPALLQRMPSLFTSFATMRSGSGAAPAPDGAHSQWLARQHDGKMTGNASDTAFLRYCDMIYPIEEVQARFRVLHRIPFNSDNKWALTVVQPRSASDAPACAQSGAVLGMLKGAPEVVLSMCSAHLLHGAHVPIDAAFRAQFQAAYKRFAGLGQRVLGFAMRNEEGAADQITAAAYDVPLTAFTFIGLASLADPPKRGVGDAVASCRTAGISVFMVTGDHPLTAEAIARQVGIITEPTRADVAELRGVAVDDVDDGDEDVGALVLTGTDIQALATDADWDKILSKSELVFARTLPQQKLEIVRHCQRVGHVVAVTGDGVNDSPALKAADIGVAMGRGGSAVAREAAAMLLMDDNFASIVAACKEGRVLFDNLTKTVAYTLTHLWPETVGVIINLLLGMPLGMSPLQILSIDLGTELAPAISLAYQPPEAAVMELPPRDLSRDRLVSRPLLVYAYAIVGAVEAIACVIGYLLVFADYGIPSSDLLFATSHGFMGTDGLPWVAGGRAFSHEQQQQMLSEAQSAWYGNLILCQAVHLYAARTRATTACGTLPTMIMAFGTTISVLIGALIVYAPPVQGAFGTASVHAKYFTPAAVFGAFVFALTEASKARRRVQPRTGCVAHWFAW